jgi:hypothetical protein
MTLVRTLQEARGGRRTAVDPEGDRNARSASLAPASEEKPRAMELRRLLPGSNRRHQTLQQAVLDWCALRHIPAVPIHTGPRVTPLGDGSFGLRGNRAQAGVADVLATLPPFGRTALLEIKTGRAKKSAAQVEFHRRFTEAGAMSLTIHSVDDLTALLYQIARDRAVEKLGRGGK